MYIFAALLAAYYLITLGVLQMSTLCARAHPGTNWTLGYSELQCSTVYSVSLSGQVAMAFSGFLSDGKGVNC